jgi:hypothetical protein
MSVTGSSLLCFFLSKLDRRESSLSLAIDFGQRLVLSPDSEVPPVLTGVGVLGVTTSNENVLARSEVMSVVHI